MFSIDKFLEMTLSQKGLIKASIIGLLCFFFTGCSMVKYTIEHAPYQVLESDDNVEIRHYDELLLVTTPMALEAKHDGDEGSFRRLFNYISGDNSESQEISMTAPVFMDEKRDETMSFVLPKDFSLSSTPVPLNDTVKVEQITDYTVAVIQFSGWLDQVTIQTNKTKLQHWLREKNLESQGKARIAGYDPPSSIPFFRRNEVLIPINWPGTR